MNKDYLERLICLLFVTLKLSFICVILVLLKRIDSFNYHLNVSRWYIKQSKDAITGLGSGERVVVFNATFNNISVMS